MYELYIANKNYSSWSLRPWILMHELEIPFKEHVVPFEQGENWKSFRTFSPTGLVPCLHDHSTVVWESLGITEYLAERHDSVWPVAPSARAWARCASAEMHSGFGALRTQCSMNCGIRVRLNEISPALKRDIDRISELWNEGLVRFGSPFLAGETFTAVDAFFAPVAFRIQTYGLMLDEAPASYAKRILALPSMQSWYHDALAEPWREPGHEAEAEQVGILLEDMRTAVL